MRPPALVDVVWIDPDRMSGVPCFKGTRVPIQALIDHIEGNSTLEDSLMGFPSVSRSQAIQFIGLATEADISRLVQEHRPESRTKSAKKTTK